MTYVPKWMPLLDAIEHVRAADSATIHDACEALLAALRDGAITSRYHASGLFGGDGFINPAVWDRARVFSDGSVEFDAHPAVPPAPPELVSPGHQIDVCRAYVLECWPERDRGLVRTPDNGEAGVDGNQIEPPHRAGIRTNRAATAETKCGEWIAGLKHRPTNKDAAFEQAKSEVKGPLSRAGFERAWARNARPGWKEGGRRKRG